MSRGCTRTGCGQRCSTTTDVGDRPTVDRRHGAVVLTLHEREMQVLQWVFSDLGRMLSDGSSVDIVTQRLIKAMLAGRSNPYSDDELSAIAANCTQKEDAANKVEREMSKRLAAAAMENRIGAIFDAIVTGVTPHGTFVRVLQPHVEGLLAQGQQGVDVGDRMRVKLIRTDVQRGFIDFAAVRPKP